MHVQKSWISGVWEARPGVPAGSWGAGETSSDEMSSKTSGQIAFRRYPYYFMSSDVGPVLSGHIIASLRAKSHGSLHPRLFCGASLFQTMFFIKFIFSIIRHYSWLGLLFRKSDVPVSRCNCVLKSCLPVSRCNCVCVPVYFS